MTTAELIAYYQNLIIIQYALQPHALATVGAVVEQAIADQIIQQVADGFDLDTAIGAQLDAIATYSGAQRSLFGIDLGKEYFEMPSYDDLDPDADKGFALYGDSPTWFFAVYQDADHPSYVLTDGDFRAFISYLIDVEAADLGLGDIDNLLFKHFGSYLTLDDNEDMTITYTDDPSDPSNLFKIVSFTNTFPKPAGVQVIVA